MNRAARLFTLTLLLGAANGCTPKQEPAAAAPVAEAGGQGVITLPANSPMLKELHVAALESRTLATSEVSAPAKIEANANRVSRVALPLAGRIAEVMVRLGDAVRQSQPLVSISSPDADAAAAAHLQAVAGLAQARANLGKAQSDYDRSKDLFEHNAIARKEVLNNENALAQAQAVKDQAAAALEQATRRMSLLDLKPGEYGQKVLVRAPISGKVLDIAVAPGEYRNDTSAVLMTIADLSTVWAAADVPESSIRFIRVGERVDIELSAFPGETMHGTVTRIADTVDPATRAVKVRAELPNPNLRLKPEMFGRMRHIESTATVPVAPVGAVVEAAGHSIVYRELSPGKFQVVEVKTGHPDRASGMIPILEGLKTGERIVVDGAMLLKSYTGGTP